MVPAVVASAGLKPFSALGLVLTHLALALACPGLAARDPDDADDFRFFGDAGTGG